MTKETKSGWSRWYSWPLDRAAGAYPSNIRRGDWIESDLAIRLHMVHWLKRRRQAIYNSFVWQVETGEAFLLEAPASQPSTHCVLSRYRIWQGDGSPYGMVSEKLEEMA